MKFNHEDMYFYRPLKAHTSSNCCPVNLFFCLHDNNTTFTMGRPKTGSHKHKCKKHSTPSNVATPTAYCSYCVANPGGFSHFYGICIYFRSRVPPTFASNNSPFLTQIVLSLTYYLATANCYGYYYKVVMDSGAVCG
jgi:hypothetical protein